jgi:hypothetical protein
MMKSFNDLEFHAHHLRGFSSMALVYYPDCDVTVSAIDGWNSCASKSTYEVSVTNVDDGGMVILEYMTEADITYLMGGMAEAKTNIEAREFFAECGADRATPEIKAEIEKCKARKDAEYAQLLSDLRHEQMAKKAKKTAAEKAAEAAAEGITSHILPTS